MKKTMILIVIVTGLFISSSYAQGDKKSSLVKPAKVEAVVASPNVSLLAHVEAVLPIVLTSPVAQIEGYARLNNDGTTEYIKVDKKQEKKNEKQKNK